MHFLDIIHIAQNNFFTCYAISFDHQKTLPMNKVAEKQLCIMQMIAYPYAAISVTSQDSAKRSARTIVQTDNSSFYFETLQNPTKINILIQTAVNSQWQSYWVVYMNIIRRAIMQKLLMIGQLHPSSIFQKDTKD